MEFMIIFLIKKLIISLNDLIRYLCFYNIKNVFNDFITLKMNFILFRKIWTSFLCTNNTDKSNFFLFTR